MNFKSHQNSIFRLNNSTETDIYPFQGLPKLFHARGVLAISKTFKDIRGQKIMQKTILIYNETLYSYYIFSELTYNKWYQKEPILHNTANWVPDFELSIFNRGQRKNAEKTELKGKISKHSLRVMGHRHYNSKKLTKSLSAVADFREIST